MIRNIGECDFLTIWDCSSWECTPEVKSARNAHRANFKFNWYSSMAMTIMGKHQNWSRGFGEAHKTLDLVYISSALPFPNGNGSVDEFHAFARMIIAAWLESITPSFASWLMYFVHSWSEVPFECSFRLQSNGSLKSDGFAYHSSRFSKTDFVNGFSQGIPLF